MQACVAGFGDEDFDFEIVGNDNGAVGHGLRADGDEGEGAQCGLQNGAAGGQRIGSGAGGRGDDEAVRALGINKFAVHKHFKFNHLPRAAARQHHIVQGQRLMDGFAVARHDGFQHQAFVRQIFAGEHAGQFGEHVFARYLR